MIASPDLHYEKILWKGGYSFIAGLDEAGRGALAGPVCVGCVILPNDDPHLARTLRGVRDSKQLTPRERSRLAPCIKETSLAYGVGFSSSDEIDSLGIVSATRLAASRALESLIANYQFPNYLLTDFRLELPELDIPQTSIVKGDCLSLSIAAASILAKTARDALMFELDSQYPGYRLGKHKGYGTQFHRLAMKRMGLSPIHRKTFAFRNP